MSHTTSYSNSNFKQTITLDATTARSLGIDLRGQHSATIVVVPNRKRGKRMSSRSGQSGSVMTKHKKWWVGRYYIDTPEGRKRPAITLGLIKHMTKSQAERKLMGYITAMGINEKVSPIDPTKRQKTFAELVEWWRANKLALHKRSYQEVTEMRLKHILSFFGNTPVDEIGEEQAQEFVAYLTGVTYKTRDGVEHKLGASYLRDVVLTLKRIIGKNAAQWELTFPEVAYKEQRFFTPSEMLQIINAAKGKWKPLFALLAETGLRCGEAFGLHIEDIDRAGGRLSVRRSIWKGSEDTPKTRNGYRVVAITPELCGMLERHIGNRTAGYVFETRNGRPLNKEASRYTLQSILKRLGLPKGGLHAFRHGRVSVLQMNGVPGDLIREWVGHSNLKITSRYTHFDEKFRQEVARKNGLLASANEGLLVPKTGQMVPILHSQPESETLEVSAA